MHPLSHFADRSSFRTALLLGLVEAPEIEWDPASGSWLIAARPRQGGARWVLSHGDRPVGLDSREQAQRLAEGLRAQGL